MKLLLASLILLAVEAGFVLAETYTESRAARDLLGAVLLLALLMYLAYLISLKRC